MLYGTAETEPQADIVVAQLAQELYNSNLLLLLVQNLSRIDFEVCFKILIQNTIINYLQQFFISSSTTTQVCTNITSSKNNEYIQIINILILY